MSSEVRAGLAGAGVWNWKVTRNGVCLHGPVVLSLYYKLSLLTQRVSLPLKCHMGAGSGLYHMTLASHVLLTSPPSIFPGNLTTDGQTQPKVRCPALVYQPL